jgi:hypothetical protein
MELVISSGARRSLQGRSRAHSSVRASRFAAVACARLCSPARACWSLECSLWQLRTLERSSDHVATLKRFADSVVSTREARVLGARSEIESSAARTNMRSKCGDPRRFRVGADARVFRDGNARRASQAGIWSLQHGSFNRCHLRSPLSKQVAGRALAARRSERNGTSYRALPV